MIGVRKWLEGVGLAQYADAFEANEIDMDLLQQVDDQISLTVSDSPTDGCRDIERCDAAACSRVVEFRSARTRAVQRDELDRQIDALDREIAGMPAIGSADAGAAWVSEVMPWVTGGVIRPTEGDVRRLRVLLITLLPACAGVLLGLVGSLRGRAVESRLSELGAQ